MDKTTGGKGGIRTLGTISGTQSFQDCRLNHSRTFPKLPDYRTLKILASQQYAEIL